MIDIAKKVLRNGAVALATIAAVGAYASNVEAKMKTASYVGRNDVGVYECLPKVVKKELGKDAEYCTLQNGKDVAKFIANYNGKIFYWENGDWHAFKNPVNFSEYSAKIPVKKSATTQTQKPAPIQVPVATAKPATSQPMQTYDDFQLTRMSPKEVDDLIEDSMKGYSPEHSESPVRYTLGFTTEGLNGSVDFKVGENFRFGPYVQFRNNVKPDTKHNSKVIYIDKRIIVPGVYEEATDRVKTETETSLDNPEYGVRLGYVLPGKPVEFFASLGITQKDTVKRKTLSSDVIFTDNFGNQIGNIQHASKTSEKHDKTDVAVFGVGAEAMATENIGLEAVVKTVDGKLSILGGAKLHW